MFNSKIVQWMLYFSSVDVWLVSLSSNQQPLVFVFWFSEIHFQLIFVLGVTSRAQLHPSAHGSPVFSILFANKMFVLFSLPDLGTLNQINWWCVWWFTLTSLFHSIGLHVCLFWWLQKFSICRNMKPPTLASAFESLVWIT